MKRWVKGMARGVWGGHGPWVLAWSLALCGALTPAVLRAEGIPADEEARSLFVLGRTAFEEGRFDVALQEFEASHALSRKPELLYNIAQCHDRLRHDQDAIAAFERYLADAPEAENRPAIEARLRVLREAVEQADTARRSDHTQEGDADGAPAQPPVTLSAAHADSHQPFPLGPVLTLGSSVAVLAAGGVLMVLGRHGGDTVEHASVGVSYDALRGDLDTAKREWLAGQVLLGAGAAFAVGGALWLALDLRDTRPRVQVALLPNGLRLEAAF
ncbi:MAG TPA: tetratricopeptide repeat protein [Polyangiales bacterium]